MRKRTITFVADTVFWYLIYFLPIIAYLFMFLSGAMQQVLPFDTFFNSLGFNFFTDNVIFTSLSSLFGQNGALPIFATDTPILIFTWFISTFLIHLAVDTLLFIPRLAHKWLDSFTKKD